MTTNSLEHLTQRVRDWFETHSRDDQVGCTVFAPVDLAESRRRRYERER